MIKVYVAGPIRIGDHDINIRRAIDAGLSLIKAGFVPYVPHLDTLMRLIDPVTLTPEKCLEFDFEWLLNCNCVLRIPGESEFAEREVKHAIEHDIIVFYSLADLFTHYLGAEAALQLLGLSTLIYSRPDELQQ